MGCTAWGNEGQTGIEGHYKGGGYGEFAWVPYSMEGQIVTGG